jgi:hypothetical protein
MASNTKNVKLGVCNVTYGGIDIGYTQGGVEVTVTTDTHPVEVDQFGKTVINEIIMKRDVKVSAPLAETTLDNLVQIMPGATLVTDGAKATGTITIATNPADTETIVVNGVTLTFSTTPSGPLSVEIGADADATAANLKDVLATSSDAGILAATFTVVTSVITVDYDARGVEGNAYSLADGTSGGNVTFSGAALSGGTAVTSARVDVTTGIGISLLDIAKPLILHPIDNSDEDRTEDFVIPLAATAGALNFSYQVDKERTFPIEFMGYPDAGGKLFYVGEADAV